MATFAVVRPTASGRYFSKNTKYDSNGQFLNANFADYGLPTVAEMPKDLKIGHLETPSPYTEYGIKGGGEGGRMGSPSAIARAVEDALKPFGGPYRQRANTAG